MRNSELYLEAAAGVHPEEAIRRAQARESQVLDKSKTCGLTAVETRGQTLFHVGDRLRFLDALALEASASAASTDSKN